ncbi:MAG: hypothetical protein HJJLKODD_03030 [Phycisphaerae bacterium]|nr:hypothetical protein [Phycisphaerae bacterium]
MVTIMPAMTIPVIFYSAGTIAVILFALLAPDTFTSWTRQHPFLMGYAKFFILGTFGELLKFRLSRGHWRLEHILERAFVWGWFGCWLVLIFPGFEALVDGLVAKGYWPATAGPIAARYWLAFSKSFWLNGLGMFGFGMMVTHDYFNHLITTRWRNWSLYSFAEAADKQFLLAFIPKTLLFWIAAQTFNYLMPANWRVFIAGLLASVLGFLLSVGRSHRI